MRSCGQSGNRIQAGLRLLAGTVRIDLAYLFSIKENICDAGPLIFVANQVHAGSGKCQCRTSAGIDCLRCRAAAENAIAVLVPVSRVRDGRIRLFDTGGTAC